jgi:hypothetical protein
MTTPQSFDDPNRVILTGENPFIRLFQGSPQTTEATTDASFWRVLYSGAGPGHVLFLRSELTGGQHRVYSDSLALARWLQREITRYLNPQFGNTDLPVVHASFQSSGDLRSAWSEIIRTRDEEIALTWSDLLEPILMHSAPGSAPNRPHGVCTVFIPAREARLTVNGKQAAGMALPARRGNRDFSTSSLAFSESWLLPR